MWPLWSLSLSAQLVSLLQRVSLLASVAGLSAIVFLVRGLVRVYMPVKANTMSIPGRHRLLPSGAMSRHAHGSGQVSADSDAPHPSPCLVSRDPDTQALVDDQLTREQREAQLAALEHPSSGFSMLRFVVALPGADLVQPVEICFHDTFRPRDASPLPLHLHGNSLTMMHPALALVSPSLPGVIVDCGRVDLFEQDCDAAEEDGIRWG
ncbi:hypothetical protein NM208_g16895 [Fusarium decemcellulare]|uniref:Uncharacterized protein n=1 Tax=Fusarium decemcellulare TaxID=57161 RepID=A0ACC1R8W6_9HYPO|nr:hypothetical protein NM208_g16895 [Fusarium decemcellulare]